MRNKEKIKSDVEKIIQASKNGAKSWADISKKTGMTMSEIRTTMSHFEEEKAKIQECLKKNRKDSTRKSKQEKKTDLHKKRYIIDASISAVSEASSFISDVIDGVIQNASLVITSVTREELRKMQKFNDTEALGARRILAKMAENPEIFENIRIIRKEDQSADDCIIEYCAEDLSQNILLTADKDMAGAARELRVETIYFKRQLHKKQHNSIDTAKRVTLYNTFWKRGKLLLNILNSKNISTMLIKQKGEYTQGLVELEVGDDVYICSRKGENITFAHYQITQLKDTDNSILVYHRRIYFGSDPEDIPENYSEFINKFRYQSYYRRRQRR